MRVSTRETARPDGAGAGRNHGKSSGIGRAEVGQVAGGAQ